MKITTAKNSGTCFGVDNAIKIAFKAAEESGNLKIKGELVHNPYVVNKLAQSGVKTIDSLHDLNEGDSLIIRAHGESKKTYDFCKENGVNIIDCTCPFVKKAQNIATSLEEDGYHVVIIGDPEHPEVKGIVAQTENAKVIHTPDDFKKEKVRFGKLGILSQTTQTIENFSEIVSKIVSYPKIIKIHNTICTATQERQKAAKKLSKKVELMIVIGGKNSSNTKKLYEICSENTETRWITSENELDKKRLKGINSVGITAGASTPKEIIEKVEQEISENI